MKSIRVPFFLGGLFAGFLLFLAAIFLEGGPLNTRDLPAKPTSAGREVLILVSQTPTSLGAFDPTCERIVVRSVTPTIIGFTILPK